MLTSGVGGPSVGGRGRSVRGSYTPVLQQYWKQGPNSSVSRPSPLCFPLNVPSCVPSINAILCVECSVAKIRALCSQDTCQCIPYVQCS